MVDNATYNVPTDSTPSPAYTDQSATPIPSDSAVTSSTEEELPKHSYRVAVGTDAEADAVIDVQRIVLRDGTAYLQAYSYQTGAQFEAKLSDFRYCAPPTT